MAAAGCGAAPDDGGGADPSETAESGGAAGAGVVNGAGSAGTAAGGETAGTTNPGTGGAAGNAGPGTGGKGGSGGTSGAGGSSGAGGTAGTRNDAGIATTDAGFGNVDAGPSSMRQTPHPLGGNNTAPNGYYEYLPPGWSVSTMAPLLVFWHGIGENGNGSSDLQKVLSWGPSKIIAANKWDSSRPFVVLSPQYVPANGQIAPGGGCPSSATINAFLTWAIPHYNADKKRVYLTGLSCGAIGGWDYLANFQGTVVAAAVLFSGNPGVPTQQGSAWNRAGCTLGTAAIWSMHGDKDGIVPYAPDHDTLQNLIACPMPPRRAAVFTDIVGGDHVIWDPLYDLSGGYGDIYQWMLDNAKP